MAERKTTLRLAGLGAIAVALLAAAFGGGFAIADRTRDSDATTTPEAVAGDGGVQYAADESTPGRVLLTRTDCSGDGKVVAAFNWTRAAGQEEASYRIAVFPKGTPETLANLKDGIYRDSLRGQAKIGGLNPTFEYTVKVVGAESDNWARGALTTPACNPGGACPPSADLLAQGPASGTTTDTTARVWVRTCYPAPVAISYREAGAPLTAAVSTAEQRTDPERDNTAVFNIGGLRPFQKYDYVVTVGGISIPHAPASFWTMPPKGAPTKLRFLTASDVHSIRMQNRVGQLAMPQMLRAEPQFALMIGDNVDVDGFGAFDPTSAESYLRDYRDNWSYAPMRNFLAGVSTRMMWDDHDLLNDWDRKDAAPYAFARKAFSDFIGRQNPDPVQEGSTYFTFDAGDISVFVLDVRSFRSPKRQADDAQKSMLGAQQKADLKEWLTTSTAKFKFISSGVQWNDHQVVPLRKDDAWDGFRTEREEIFDFINANGVDGVMLLSGDAHWPAVIRHSYGIIEFQTTPSGVSPPAPPPSVQGASDVLYAEGQKNVFGRFDVDTTVSPARVDFAMVDNTGAELFTLTLTETDLAR